MSVWRIDEAERYPVYSLGNVGKPTIDLTDEEFADYQAASAKWEAWQDRLFQASCAHPPFHVKDGVCRYCGAAL